MNQIIAVIIAAFGLGFFIAPIVGMSPARYTAVAFRSALRCAFAVATLAVKLVVVMVKAIARALKKRRKRQNKNREVPVSA